MLSSLGKTAKTWGTVVLSAPFLLIFFVLQPLFTKVSDVAWVLFGKRPKAQTPAELGFAAAVKAAAELRKQSNLVGCNVTPAFQPMADELSLAGFRDYVFDRYEGDHGKHVGGTYDWIDIRRNELRRYDRVFRWNEWLRIIFIYADDGTTIVRFQATLLIDML